MIDPEPPVTVDELHAFVDGQLPEDRREAVETWLADHPEQAQQVAHWRSQAEALRSRYGATAHDPVPARLDLDRLTASSSPMRWRSLAAAVVIAALLGGLGGWFARGTAGSAPVAPAPSLADSFTTEALDAYKLYVAEVRHPVEVPASERAHLVQWLSKRLDYGLRAPDMLPSLGLTLVGGRLLPGPQGTAAAFFMYESQSGERFTISCAKAAAAPTSMHYKEGGNIAAFFWIEDGLAYVVSGPAERTRLWKVAQEYYDQIEKPQAK